MARDDYAILVGISRYADAALPRLEGPVGDVDLMRGWLQSSGGGAVPASNITSIVSDEASARSAADGELPPVVQDFMNAFLRVVRKPDRSGFIRREHGRLYLFFSGHGFCEKHARSPHAALYAANADRDVHYNIFGTYYAQWTKDHALFGEIVLLMDCCRDAELAKLPQVPVLRKPTDIGTGNSAKLLEIYAAPRGGKAQERPIASRNSEVHGLLTHAFLEALGRAAPGQPKVNSTAIKGYLTERWADLCAGNPADPPEVVVPTNGDIEFSRGEVGALTQRFLVKQLPRGGRFELIDGQLNHFADVAVQSRVANMARPGQPILQARLQANEFALPLPAGFYLAVAPLGQETLRCKFQAGGERVEL